MVYSRDNVARIEDGADVINLDEYSGIGTHWISLSVNNSNNVTYFDSFGVKHISQRKLKHLWVIKTLKQIFLEYEHMIQ